jgi:hypothetical protein
MRCQTAPPCDRDTILVNKVGSLLYTHRLSTPSRTHPPTAASRFWSIGGRRGEKSRIAIGHGAPKFSSTNRRADSLVGRPTTDGGTSCQSSGPTGKFDLVGRKVGKFRVTFLARHFPPTWSAEQSHPRDQNFGDGAPGRHFENGNFPRNVPIEVTLLANCPRSPNGAVRARRKFRYLVGGLNRAKKSRIAFGHRAPKCRSTIRRAEPEVGRCGRPTTDGGTSCQSSGPTDKSDPSGRSVGRRENFVPPFSDHQLAERGHSRDQNFGDSARGRRCENVNFPRDVPIRVTLLADHRRRNFLPKFRSDLKIRPGRTETQELPRDFFGPLISGHLAGGAESSARPKFRGQCARSALRKCEFSAGRPYRGLLFWPIVRRSRMGRCERAGNFAIWSADPMVEKSHGSRSDTVRQNVLPPPGARTQWWVSPPTEVGRPNFLPKFRPDWKIRPGRTETQELPRDFWVAIFRPTGWRSWATRATKISVTVRAVGVSKM